MIVKLKETKEKGLRACGFGSIQLKPLDTPPDISQGEFEVIDHSKRPHADLLRLIKMCVDVESIDGELI